MPKAPRGTQDLLPSEQPYWALVHERISAICKLYGYQRLETPMFEEASLFQRGIGEGTDIVEKEMYTFKDHGGDLMTLRPEGTASVCRSYIEHGMHSLSRPVRLYYLADIFRYERPQAGRFRQHHQFGCEAIGEADPALDAEVIELLWRFYASLRLQHLTLHLNSIGCPACRPPYVQGLREYFAQQKEYLCADCKARIDRNALRLLDCKKEECRKIAEGAPKITEALCPECAAHFQQVRESLEGIEIPFEVNPFLVRGLDYYTRTVFEILPPGEGAQSVLGGGGRYDLLIEELGGRPTPAIGFASGLERVILNLKRQGIEPSPIVLPKVYVAYVDEEGKRQALKLVASLRDADIAATVAIGDRKLKAQLRQANSQGAAYVVIAGGDELTRGNVVLRDMSGSEQQEIPLQQTVASLRNLLQ
jgi:histidyl-tRNA synthetase